MKQKIAIIDYGVGNIMSVKNAFEFINNNIQIELVKGVDKIKNFDKIILPGVGAFKNAINLIKSQTFDKVLIEEAKKGTPILGICLGMQLLGTKSFEGGEFEGLNLIEGDVLHFPVDLDIKIPHMGWNSIMYKEHVLFNDIKQNEDFYFVHSYYFKCRYEKNILAMTNHGIEFHSAIINDNVYGLQFHPEKSQKQGLKILENFICL